jgi:hypothetical protein
VTNESKENKKLEIKKFDNKFVGKWLWVYSSMEKANLNNCHNIDSYEPFKPTENNINLILELSSKGSGSIYFNDSLLSSFFCTDKETNNYYILNGTKWQVIAFSYIKDSYSIGDTIRCNLPMYAYSGLLTDEVRLYTGYNILFVKIE